MLYGAKMSFWSKIQAEFDRAPIATISAPSGVLVGIGAIVIAWIQLAATSPSAMQIQRGASNGGVGFTRSHSNIYNAIIVIGAFIALTPSLASMTRLLYKVNKFTAVPISIIIASLYIFVNRVNASNLGFGTESNINTASLDNLLYYGTVTVFIAVAGRQPLLDFARLGIDKKTMSSEDAIGTLGVVVISVLIWGGLVGWAQRQLVIAFMS